MSVRRAVPQDLGHILELCGERVYPALHMRGQTARQRQQAMHEGFVKYWDRLDTDPQLTLLVSDNGFLVLFTDLVESITGEPQSMIYDLYARTPEELGQLVEAAEQRALETGSNYTYIELAVGEAELERFFEQRGYQVEVCRIMRTVLSRPTREPNYRMRPARPSDKLFIVWLSGQTGLNTVVPGRSSDGETIAARFFATYLESDFTEDPGVRTFIAEDPDSPKQLGYLILKFGYVDGVDQQQLAYIYDVAVRPDYWGKRVVHDLMDQVDHFLVENNITLLQGDISQSNQRALRTATRALGFGIEWQRWARKIR